MIFAIVRTAIAALRRDRASLALSFVLPIAFFTIFATIFGSQHNTVPRIRVIVVDEDRSSASRELMKGLDLEGSLTIETRPPSKTKGVGLPKYPAATGGAA